MSSPDGQRLEASGPLERSHMKDMVQRNALESAAYVKLARHLENQKRAFVRQNTRDEGEMKNLLCRLQMEQQMTISDTDVNIGTGEEIDENEVIGISRADEPAFVANPYPITIIPRFGSPPNNKQPAEVRTVFSRLGSSTGSFRRKSVEYEDIQESLSSMAISNMYCVSDRTVKASFNSATKLSHDDHTPRDWLATPGAISSVRRMRKSVTEQTQLRYMRQSLSEQHTDQWMSNSSCPASVSHSRSNSLKDRKSKTKDPCEPSSPGIRIRRRGNSLKERKTSFDQTPKKRLSRSSSVLSSVSFIENRKTERKSPTKEMEVDAETCKVKRKNSKKSEKQAVTRQSSNDSTACFDCNSPGRTASSRHITVEVVSGQ